MLEKTENDLGISSVGLCQLIRELKNRVDILKNSKYYHRRKYLDIDVKIGVLRNKLLELGITYGGKRFKIYKKW